MVEAAWHYRHWPGVGRALAQRVTAELRTQIFDVEGYAFPAAEGSSSRASWQPACSSLRCERADAASGCRNRTNGNRGDAAHPHALAGGRPATVNLHAAPCGMRDEPKPAVAGPTGEAQRVERDAPQDVRPEYMGKQATSTRGPPSPTPLPFGATI